MEWLGKVKSAIVVAHDKAIDVLCPIVQSIEGAAHKVDYKAAAAKAGAIFATGGSIATAMKDADVFAFVMLFAVSALAFYLDLQQRKRMGPSATDSAATPPTDQSPIPAPVDATAPPTAPPTPPPGA